MDDSYERAKDRLRPLFEEHVKFAAPLGMLRYSDEQMEAVGPSGAARHIAASSDFEDVLKTRAWFCGSPEDTIAYLKEVEDKYPGLDQIMIACPMGTTMEQFHEQAARISKEVMPAFPGVAQAQ